MVLFDAETGKAERLDVPGDLFYAQWLKDGDTFVAYSTDDAAWNVFNTHGAKLRAIVQMNPAVLGGLVNRVDPSPDGKTILYQRTGDSTFQVYNVATGSTRSFPSSGGTNNDPHFSPDGQTIAYVTETPDSVSLSVADTDARNVRVIRSLTGAGHNIGIQAWSPDGNSILAWVDARNEVIDLNGNVVWADTIGQRLTSLDWAGLDRLLVLQPEVTDQKGTSLQAQAWYVHLPDGSASTAPVDWTADAFCCMSLSPDAARVVIRRSIALPPEYQNDYFGIAPGGAKCTLADVHTNADVAGVVSDQRDVNTAFCSFMDWSADGRFALASRGGT